MHEIVNPLWQLLCGLVLVVAGSGVLAQPTQQQAPDGTSPASSAEFDVQLKADEANRLGQLIYFTILIKSLAKNDFRTNNIDISILGPSSERFVANKSSNTVECPVTGAQVLAAGHIWEQPCRLEMKPGLYLFNAEIVVRVKLKGAAGEEFQHYPRVRVRAPEYSIFVGGAVGSLMLGLFAWLSAIITRVRGRQALQAAPEGLSIIAISIRGALMAAMLLALTGATQASASPIQLTVLDFSGGVLVGMLSVPLAQWLASILSTSELLGNPSEPAPTQANPPAAGSPPAG